MNYTKLNNNVQNILLTKLKNNVQSANKYKYKTHSEKEGMFWLLDEGVIL